MKKVLIIGSAYTEETSASGVCVKNIAHEYKRRGYNVHVIANWHQSIDAELDDEGIHVHILKQPWFYRVKAFHESHRSVPAQIVFKSIAFLRRIFLVPFYPDISPVRSRRVYHLAERLILEEHIDTVLATCFPYESIYTAVRLKMKYKDQLYVCCGHLDLLLDPNTKQGVMRRFQENRARKAVENELRLVDKIIVPENKKSEAVKNLKVNYAGFPVYVSSRELKYEEFCFDAHTYNIAYVGTINMTNRDPYNVCRFLSMLNEKMDKPIMLHIWGKLEAGVPEVIEKYSFVHYHGTVGTQYVMDILRRADCLLNITNANSFDRLPSKIFQVFASQRPVMNFVKNRADCTLPYFDRYGNELRIYEDDHVEEMLESARLFLKNSRNSSIPFPEDLVRPNTPEYYIDLIKR